MKTTDSADLQSVPIQYQNKLNKLTSNLLFANYDFK